MIFAYDYINLNERCFLIRLCFSLCGEANNNTLWGHLLQVWSYLKPSNGFDNVF